MRELILVTTAIPSKLSAPETVEAMKAAISSDPSFQLMDAQLVEQPDCTYTKLVTQCALEGSRGEEYYQHKGFKWPVINFFVNSRAGSKHPVVYARSADAISEDLCNQATNQAARVIDAAEISDTKIHVAPNYKALAAVGGAIILFMVAMGFLSMW